MQPNGPVADAVVPVSRRGFMKAAAVASTAVLAPTIIPGTALGKNGAVAPSERLVMGLIGCGGRGPYDLSVAIHERDVQFVAVCDVQKPRVENVKRSVDQRYGNSDCKIYRDFRELLARPDIDAVIAAPGDRWHAIMACMAMKAGKDIYCEKPSTMSVAEGQALVATGRRTGRIFQTGTQRRSEANFVLADELARSGRLGKIHTVWAHTLPFFMKHDWLPAEPQPTKDEFDWDMWLGPAPWRPFNRAYTGDCMTWLDYWDFGTGTAGWCSHTICQCQGAIGADLTSAVEYEYPKNTTSEGLICRYANGIKLVLSINGWRGSCGMKYEGTEGWVSMADGYPVPDVSSPSLLADRARIVADYMERRNRPMNHMRDFLNCVRSRRGTISPPEVAHRSMTTCHAANVCMLLQRNLKWDPEKERFIGDEEANRFLTRSTREPWRV